MTDILSRVGSKVASGERLSDEDALALFEGAELAQLGRLADTVNRQKNHDVVFYNVNRHINPTNICALSCKFCAYSRKPGEEGAYAYSIEEMVVKATEAVEQGATEVHMVGGLHPRWKLEHYKEMIAAVKAAHPHIHIKAFTAVELDWFARRARKTVEEVLRELQAVGLGSLPGGGAEIFHPEVRDAICDTKVTAEQWIDTHRTAHRLGMHSNCTMLYGHIETYAHRVDHMRRLRALQDETHGFNAFIPLSFQPFQNEMGIDRYTFGYDDLKTLAIARLYLDNFRHVKAYWIMLGQDIAQLALHFGANDLDGTVIEEKISRMAGGRAGMAMGRGFIENLVLKAKRQPCERDTLYNAIGTPVPVKPESRAGAGRDSKDSKDSSEKALRQVLNKADYGEHLSHDDLLVLAAEASLHELGRLATQTPERLETSGEGSLLPVVRLKLADVKSVGQAVQQLGAATAACLERYKLRPSLLAIDLAAAPGSSTVPDLGMLLELLWACRHTYPEQELSVWGSKGFWSLSQAAQVTLGALAERLMETGLYALSGSPDESETDLTHSEISNLHRQVQAAGLYTVAKVELTAPTHGIASPQWDSFLKRVSAFANLASSGPRHDQERRLVGLSIEASPGSFVTPVEYLRAIALARLAAPGVPSIIAPLARMPALSPPSGLGTASYQHPAEKFAALALHYGADDLGCIDVEQFSPIAVLQQIRSTGQRPVVREARDARRNQAPRQSPDVARDLRHIPGLAAAVSSQVGGESRR